MNNLCSFLTVACSTSAHASVVDVFLTVASAVVLMPLLFMLLILSDDMAVASGVPS